MLNIDTSGELDRENPGEQSEKFPWVINEEKTKIISDDANEKYEEICNISRDFEVGDNKSSGIPLKATEKLEMTVGYKIYRSITYKFPLHKGLKENLVWTVVESPKAAVNVIASVASALAMLSIFSF